MSKKKLTPREKQRARRLQIATAVEQGKTREWCMEKFGVSDRTVRAACEVHDVEYDRKTANPATIVAIVAALVKAHPNSTAAGIADELATTKQRVHQVLEQCREHGLVPPGKFRQ